MEKEKYQQLSIEEVKKFEEENMTDTEIEMSEEKARKFEQREQMPPILIIYRDNDLFEEYVPEMERILISQGRRVEVKNFLRDTDKNEIEEWYKENLKRLSGVEIISDTTAGVPFISSEFHESTEKKGIKTIGYLDSLIENALKEMIWSGERSRRILGDTDWRENSLGRSLDEQKQYSQNWYRDIAKRIFENQENIPNKIYIFSDHISDHFYFIEKEEMIKEEGGREKIIEIVTEVIRNGLSAGGMNVDKIIIQSDDPSQQDLENIDQPGNLVIIDRHSHAIPSKLKSVKCLKLPEGNFYRGARDYGFFSSIPQKHGEFIKKLESALEKKVGS